MSIKINSILIASEKPWKLLSFFSFMYNTIKPISSSIVSAMLILKSSWCWVCKFSKIYDEHQLKQCKIINVKWIYLYLIVYVIIHILNYSCKQNDVFYQSCEEIKERQVYFIHQMSVCYSFIQHFWPDFYQTFRNCYSHAWKSFKLYWQMEFIGSQ